jgi:hypothetical protein
LARRPTSYAENFPVSQFPGCKNLFCANLADVSVEYHDSWKILAERFAIFFFDFNANSEIQSSPIQSYVKPTRTRK